MTTTVDRVHVTEIGRPYIIWVQPSSTKASYNHRGRAEMARAHGGMFATAAFAIVLVAHDDPAQALSLVVSGNFRKSLSGFATDQISAMAGLSGERVDRTEKHVVADVVEVASVAQPRPGHRDMVRRAFPLSLEEQGEVQRILSVPSAKGCEKLKSLALGGDDDFGVVLVGGRRLIAFV